MGFKTTQREIWEIYNDVYQLKRLPGPPLCGLEWAEELAQEIITSLKEHLQQRQGPTMPGGQEWGPTRTSKPDHPAKAPWRTQQRDDDFGDHALAEAREAHHQALVATYQASWQPECDQLTASTLIGIAIQGSNPEDTRGGVPTP